MRFWFYWVNLRFEVDICYKIEFKLKKDNFSKIYLINNMVNKFNKVIYVYNVIVYIFIISIFVIYFFFYLLLL